MKPICVVVFGRTLFIEGISLLLASQEQVSLVWVDSMRTNALQKLAAQQADVLLLDLANVPATSFADVVQTQGTRPVLALDLFNNHVLVLSGQSTKPSSLTDLVHLIEQLCNKPGQEREWGSGEQEHNKSDTNGMNLANDGNNANDGNGGSDEHDGSGGSGGNDAIREGIGGETVMMSYGCGMHRMPGIKRHTG